MPIYYVCIYSLDADTHHRFLIEGESLHGTQGICCTGYVLEHDEGLPSHLQILQRHYFQNVTKLREDGVERFLQVCKKKQVVMHF